MTTQDEVKRLSEEIHKIATACLQMLEPGLQNKSSGHLSFAVGAAALGGVEKLMREIQASDWSYTPSPILSVVENKSKELFARVEEIHKFTFGPHSNQQEVTNLINRLDHYWYEAYQVIVQSLPFQRTNSRIAEESSRALAEYVGKAKEAQSAATGFKDEVKTLKAELDAVLAAAKDAARLVAVSGQGEFLSGEAKRYQGIGIAWLASAFVIATVLVIYVVSSLHYSPNAAQSASVVVPAVTNTLAGSSTNTVTLPPPPVTLGGVVASSLPRLIIVSLLFTTLVFVMRNYAAASHNEVINRHRAAALSTFRAFYEAEKGKDEAVCRAILLQAAKCIFTVQPSGFLKNEAEAPQVTQVNESLRNQ